jgi:hypothetical protein
MKRRGALLAAVVVSACAYVPPPATRGRFDAYGEYDPDRRVSASVVKAVDVRVFYGTAPAGFSLRDNELTVEPGFGHRILGTVRVEWTGERACWGYRDTYDKRTTMPVTKPKAIEQMKAIAASQGGDAIIYVSSRISDEPLDGEVCSLLREGHRGDLAAGWVVALVAQPAATEPAAASATVLPSATP